MNKVLKSVGKYIYSIFACLYLFLIGFLFPKNRHFIQIIFKHFDFRKRLKRSAKNPKAEIQDSELKEQLENYHFARYAMYIDIAAFIQEVFHKENFKNPKILEFGGSNGIIKKMFHHPNYEVAEKYPRVDISDLGNFRANYYNFRSSARARSRSEEERARNISNFEKRWLAYSYYTFSG